MGKRRSVEKDPTPAVVAEGIEQSILVVRGRKVLLDSQLAAFCGVETRVLTQAVKRNALARDSICFATISPGEEYEPLDTAFLVS